MYYFYFRTHSSFYCTYAKTIPLTKRLQAFNAQLEEKVTLRTSDLVHKSEALSQKQQKFKSLYEYHPDPIFTIDLNGVFLNVNKAGSILLGVPTDELLGETCFFDYFR